MKILVYGLNFAPEPTGVGKYTGEMSAWLAASGDEVRVVTASPYYPDWKVQPGYSGSRFSYEEWRSVKVWRTPFWVPRRPGAIKRILHLLSFAVLSLPALLRQIAWRPEVVIVVAPAIFCAPAALVAARLSGAKAWLHIQDFEVDAAFAMGILKGRLIRRLMSGLERWLLTRFDRVSTISNRMVAGLHGKRVDASRVVLFPNWVDVEEPRPAEAPSRYRDELKIPMGSVVALYSGSMVAKQGLELLPATARALQESVPNLVFIFCGEGVYKREIESRCSDLPNVRILPLQPAARLREFLRMADIHLLPQRPQAADLVMPSKLAGMFSSARVVLATADPGTELAEVVAGRGVVVAPGDAPAFATALSTLARRPDLRESLGSAGRRYAEANLATSAVLSGFVHALQQSVYGASAPAKGERDPLCIRQEATDVK